MICNNCKDLLSEYIDKSLSKDKMAEVSSHLESCPECKKEYTELLAVVEATRQMDMVEMPEGFDIRLHNVLVSEVEKTREEERKASGFSFKKLFQGSFAPRLAMVALVLVWALVSMEWLTADDVITPRNNLNSPSVATYSTEMIDVDNELNANNEDLLKENATDRSILVAENQVAGGDIVAPNNSNDNEELKSGFSFERIMPYLPLVLVVILLFVLAFVKKKKNENK